MCQLCNIALRYQNSKTRRETKSSGLSFNTRNFITTVLPTAISDQKQIKEQDNLEEKEK